MESRKGFYIISLLILASSWTVAESFKYVSINNQLPDGDLSDRVIIFQNDNMSRHFIAEYNISDGVFHVNTNVTYDLYIPVSSQHVLRNPANPQWFNFVFYVLLGFAGVIILVVILVAILKKVWRKN